MADIDKITDISKLKEEGNTIMYSTNSYFFNLQVPLNQ